MNKDISQTKSYQDYFKDIISAEEKKKETIRKIYDENNHRTPDQYQYTYNDFTNNHLQNIDTVPKFKEGQHDTSDGNISTIEDFANLIKQLCNAAWGEGWGELSLDLKRGEDSANIVLPQILVDINSRDVTEGLGTIKPVLMDVQDEYDDKGNKTGDKFLLYRQWFDCMIEFDIFAENTKEARELQERFEKLIMVYTGYIKRKGISEMFFMREISPKSSLNFSENTPMRCILYYVRFESIIPIRVNTVNNINAKIGAAQVNSDKVKSLLDNASDQNTDIELDFFDGDNGITYK